MLTVAIGPSPFSGNGHAAASRLKTASHTTTATYDYEADSRLVRQVTFSKGGATKLTTSKRYDLMDRLQSIVSTPSTSSRQPLSYGYRYAAANQRVRTTLGDGSRWDHGCDSPGLVTSGKRYRDDGTPAPGQQFAHGFDDIGNRKSTQAGGDAAGGGLRSATYTPNSLDQYTSRTVPGAVDILGLASPDLVVTVNGAASDNRRGAFFQKKVAVTFREALETNYPRSIIE